MLTGLHHRDKKVNLASRTSRGLGLGFPNVGMPENVSANMKTPVTDAAVDQYVARIRAGGPLGKVFPGKWNRLCISFVQLNASPKRNVRGCFENCAVTVRGCNTHGLHTTHRL